MTAAILEIGWQALPALAFFYLTGLLSGWAWRGDVEQDRRREAARRRAAHQQRMRDRGLL